MDPEVVEIVEAPDSVSENVSLNDESVHVHLEVEAPEVVAPVEPVASIESFAPAGHSHDDIASRLERIENGLTELTDDVRELLSVEVAEAEAEGVEAGTVEEVTPPPPPTEASVEHVEDAPVPSARRRKSFGR